MELKEKWDELVRNFPQRGGPVRHYQELVKAYSGKKRFYHNLDHIRALYELFDIHRSSIQSPDVFQFAIWYHDFIYKILHTTINEKLSARKAYLQLKQLNWETEKIRQVEALIMDTRFHQIKASKGLPDAPWFLDMDLSILGSTAEKYDTYRRQIRKEYWVIPSPVFKKGRLRALRRMLVRPWIFQTDLFFEEYETRARENMERELILLT